MGTNAASSGPKKGRNGMKGSLPAVLLLLLSGACNVGTPIAEENSPDGGTPSGAAGETSAASDSVSSEDFAAGLPAFCQDMCTRFNACPGDDVAMYCEGSCLAYMSVFVDRGARCLELGLAEEACVNSVQTCDQYENPPDCLGSNASHDECEQQGGSDVAPTTCKGCGNVTCATSESSGVAPNAGPEPSASSCDLSADDCSDGSMYRLLCNTTPGVLTCTCFKDGEVTGSFEPQTGCLPDTSEIDQQCGWELGELSL